MSSPFGITAEELAIVFQDKIKTILTTNGRQTNIGANVLRGRRQILVADVPCVVIIEGDDRPISNESPKGIVHKVELQQHYIFQAYSICEDADNPNDQAHKMIRDLKRVTFAEDVAFRKRILWLRYGGRMIGIRNDGDKTIDALIEVDVGFVEDLAAA